MATIASRQDAAPTEKISTPLEAVKVAIPVRM
jgi:hypothetical protein